MAAEAALPLPGETVAGRYRVERLLGAGGMGSVFEVVHRVTGKHFAIKWLLPELSANGEAIKRFIREAQVAGRFDHPNAVEVYDIGQERGSLYMVMELLRGESLASHLARVQRLAPGDAASILLPCMHAVARAHGAGIIHRDLKPENIFLCRTPDGRQEQPKVLDFGISKMMDQPGDLAAHITKGGIIMGTPQYMAPEQVLGKPIDARVDVYAFGVLLHELTSGQLPFPGNSYGELVVQISTRVATPLRQLVAGVPAAFEAIVQRAMAREPANRFPDLDALAHALGPFAAHGRQPSDQRSVPRPSVSPSAGATVPLNTPLVTETRKQLTASPSVGGVGVNQLPWVIAILATGVAALVTTVALLRPTSALAPVAPEQRTATTSGAALGVERQADPLDLGAIAPKDAGTAAERTPTLRDQIIDDRRGRALERRDDPFERPYPREGRNDDERDRGDRNVIGPWQRQRLPGRGRRALRPSDDGFGELDDPTSAPDTPEPPRGHRRTGREGVLMQENEF